MNTKIMEDMAQKSEYAEMLLKGNSFFFPKQAKYWLLLNYLQLTLFIEFCPDFKQKKLYP